MAIGLVWGHLGAGQFELAIQLARGCLQVWPEEKRLLLMAAYASVELSMPLPETTLDMLRRAECAEWTERVLNRAGIKKAWLESSAMEQDAVHDA